MENYVALPLRAWKKFEQQLEELTKHKEEWINEKEAAELLNISVRSLQNRICKKEVPADHYRVGLFNNRFYNKQKIQGLK